MTDRGKIETHTGAAPAGSRSAAEIVRDIETTRERLASTIDELSERVKPANVARRGKDSLLSKVRDPEGKLRPEGLGGIAVAAIAGVAIVVRRLRRRRS